MKGVSVKVPTQGKTDSYSEKINRIRAAFFYKCIDSQQAREEFLKLGHTEQAAQAAVICLQSHGKEYIKDFERHHDDCCRKVEKEFGIGEFKKTVKKKKVTPKKSNSKVVKKKKR